MIDSPGWTLAQGLKLMSAAAVAHWLGMSAALQALLGLMALDFATGVVAGATQSQLSSRTAGKGVARKAGTLIIIVAVHIVSDIASNHFALPVDLGNVVGWFYVLTELISVIENCGRLGAPIPPYLLEAIKKAKRFQETQEQMVADIKQSQQTASESLASAQKTTEALAQTIPAPTVTKP